MAEPAWKDTEPTAERRMAERLEVDRPAEALVPGRNAMDCQIVDWSGIGARLAVEDAGMFPDIFRVYLPDVDRTFVMHVARRDGKVLGLLVGDAFSGRHP